MLNHPKSTLYSLIITVFLFVMLAGCNSKNHGKAYAVIEIDLTQPGKTLRANLYGDFFKSNTFDNRVQWKKAISDFANSPGHWNLRIYPLKDSIGALVVTKGNPGSGNLKMALDEAAFMIGMERDGGLAKRVSPVPSLKDVNGRERNPDMIVYDRSGAYGTPSYYAIKLFSENRPDRVMGTKVTMKLNSVVPALIATAGLQEKAGLVIIKIVNPSNVPKGCKVVLTYKQQIKYKGEAYVMTSGSAMDENSFKEPERVVPMTKELKGLKNTFNYECPANSIVIIKLRYKKGMAGFGNCC